MEAKTRKGSVDLPDPYVSPKDVGHVLTELSKSRLGPKKKITIPNSFRLNPKMRLRKEKFGSVIFVGQRFCCYLNVVSTEMLAKLNTNSEYQLVDFTSRFGEGGENFLARLYDRKIFLPAERR